MQTTKEEKFKQVLGEMGHHRLYWQARLQSYDDDRNDQNINWSRCYCFELDDDDTDDEFDDDKSYAINDCDPLETLQREVSIFKYFKGSFKYTEAFRSRRYQHLKVMVDMYYNGFFFDKVITNYFNDNRDMSNVNWNRYYAINHLIYQFKRLQLKAMKNNFIECANTFIPKHIQKQRKNNVLDEIKYHPLFMRQRIFEFEDTERFFEVMGY